MHVHRTLLVLLLAALAIVIGHNTNNKTTNLVTSNLRIIDPDPDDREYMNLEAAGENSVSSKTKKPTKPNTDEEKPKTLSQQIADGKYALIQKELFNKPPKRPGILSYQFNPEVPNDTANNLGGLDKNEIWLAENHLLVLRGGGFPPHDDRRDTGESPWAPLDNYKAPLHQVKIPKNPKVPPPFPVQLTEEGPLQILGTNFTRTFNGTYEEALNAIPPPEGFPPFPPSFYEPYDTDKTNATARPAAMPIPSNSPPGEYPAGVPFPPFLLNGTLPPSLGYLPPGAVVLPPPGNQTDYLDYDDPSIYYPPPYSFFYPKDNSSKVAPGPLVPGIILPPPPNFFAPLEETITPPPTRKPTRYRKPTTTQMTITITKSTTTTTTKKPTMPQKTVKIYPVKNHQFINEVKLTSTAPPPVKSVTILPEVFTAPRKPSYQPTLRRKPGVTILRPVTPPKVYIYENEIPNKPFKHYGPPEVNKIAVTSTQVPLRYHTTSEDINSNSVRENSEHRAGYRKGKTMKTTHRPAQYYFYEEENKETNTPRIPKTNTYSDANEPYYVRPRPIAPVRQRRPQYVYVTAKPYNTQKPRFRFIQQPVNPDSFSIHINKLNNQIQQYYTTPRTTYRPVPKPVYQFSFQAANYQSQQNDFKPSPEVNQQDQFQPIPAKYTVEIQQAIEIIPTKAPTYQNNAEPIAYQNNAGPIYYQHTTPRPYYTTPPLEYHQQEVVTPIPKYLQNIATPKPISEYSFEATPNPVYQGYYTKPDENYFDDRTRTYFTMFGRKLPSGTTPLPRPRPVPQDSYQQRPISLEGDTIVNYVNPRPDIDPDAEVVPVKNPSYSNVVRYSPRPVQKDNPEIIKAIPIEVPASESQDGSFISYQLPGDDGAHFYFLTPQLAQRKEQGAGFYYSKARRRRNEKAVDR